MLEVTLNSSEATAQAAAPVAPDVTPIENPTAPIVSDKVAKPLWLVLAVISVSAPPALALTVIDWAHWSPTVSTQVSATIVWWAGSMASVLGLSRYAKSSALGK